MSDFEEKGPGGVIWKTGVHQVGVDGKPTRLYSPQYSLMQLYDLLERIIESDGGVPIGFGDHIPESIIDEYPMLKKLDLHNVGEIRAVETDGESIRIKESVLTNPTVAELYNNGELSDYSIVASFMMADCPRNDADMVVDYFTKFKRVDLVSRGGCRDCRVEDLSDVNGDTVYMKIHARFMHIDDDGVDLMASDYNVNSKCLGYAKKEASAGRVDTSSAWSFSTGDGDALLGDSDDWERYSKAHLALTPGGDKNKKDTYHFPIAKMKDGKVVVYRKGVISAKQMASGARSGVKHGNIADACDEILKIIDKGDKMTEDVKVEAIELTDEVKDFIKSEIQEGFKELEATLREQGDADTDVDEQEVEAKLPDDVVEKLKEYDEMKLEAKKMKVEGLIEDAIKDGKALPAMKEALTGIGMADSDKLKELLASMPDNLVDYDERGNGEADEDKLDLEEVLRRTGRL